MIFITFDFRLSLNECVNKYEKMKKEISRISLDLKLKKVFNNGTRKKVYLDTSGKKRIIHIQRLVVDGKYYYDLFPSFLVPNSLLTIYDLFEVKNNRPMLVLRYRQNMYEKWLLKEKIDIIGLTGFSLIYKNKKLSFYQSNKEVSPYKTNKQKIKIDGKKRIFLIRLH